MEQSRSYTPVLILLGIGAAYGGWYLYDTSQKLGTNFHMNDLTRSKTADTLGIKEQKNAPRSVVKVARRFTKFTLQPVRDLLASPIYINSWWRHEKTNAAVGGVTNSGHLEGNTVDMRAVIAGVFRNDLLAKAVLQAGVPFSKMILEYGTKTRPKLIHLRATEGDDRRILLRKFTDGTFATVPKAEILAFAA